jgi:8-amino-7-oxononanoate synthase
VRELRPALETRRRQRSYRRRRVLEGATGRKAVLEDGRRVLAFCSNDYLGLANHPALVKAFTDAAERWGVGSGAAHLITGHKREHHALEEELAELTGRPRALLFSTGYMANLGVVGALAGRRTPVYEDRLNHASLLDAAGCAGARLRRYPHADAAALEGMLAHEAPDAPRLVLSDGVFSMDGDLAPLPALAEVAERQRAWLMVDDAHGLGVLGETGAGSLEHFGLGLEQVPILMGTLGKALGCFGAFVAGDEDLVETLIQAARAYIYTTAPPPAVAAAARAALRLVREEPQRRERLRALTLRLRRGAAQLGLPLAESSTPIQPLMVGDSGRALELAERLLELGILVAAIRPPTVPAGSARLRITLSAAHEEADVDRLLEVLERAWSGL